LLTNNISLILSIAVTLIVLLRIFFFQIQTDFEFIVSIFLLLLPIWLNRLSLIKLSRLACCYLPLLVIWYMFIKAINEADKIELSMYDGLRIFMLSQSFIPYLIFDKKSYGLLSIGILPTLFSILFFDFILNLAGSGPAEVMGPDNQLMTMRTFIAYLIINSGFYALLTIVSNNDRFNEKLIRDLKLKSEQVRLQNLELEASHNELAKFNQHLQELVDIKTEKISKQNDALSKYAFANAHKLRGPVARILGLIGLQRMESHLGFPWFLEKVEGEAKNIDIVIKSISVDLNQIDEDYNNNHSSPSLPTTAPAKEENKTSL
jgi:hypothetical protein